MCNSLVQSYTREQGGNEKNELEVDMGDMLWLRIKVPKLLRLKSPIEPLSKHPRRGTRKQNKPKKTHPSSPLKWKTNPLTYTALIQNANKRCCWKAESVLSGRKSILFRLKPQQAQVSVISEAWQYQNLPNVKINPISDLFKWWWTAGLKECLWLRNPLQCWVKVSLSLLR